MGNFPLNQSITCTYPSTYIPDDPRVTFYLEETVGHTKTYILFLYAQPIYSPKLYPQDTFTLIKDHLMSFDILIEDVEIYLDNLDSEPFIHYWNFTYFKELYVSDRMFPYPIDELPEKVRDVRNNYLQTFKVSTN